MLQEDHSIILLTFIKLQFVIEIFGLSIFECIFHSAFTVLTFISHKSEMVNMHDIMVMSVLYFMKLLFTQLVDKPPNWLCCLSIQSKSTVEFWLVDMMETLFIRF